VAFFENDSGQIERTARDDDDWGHELGDEYINREEGLRGERGSRALTGDNRRPTYGRVIMAEGYWNYDAFIERAELRVFDANRSTRGKPLAKADFVSSTVALFLNDDMPQDMLYVLRTYNVEVRTKLTHSR